MPPSDFQAHVLRVISAQRSPQSHVAGGLALNLDFARYSVDIDIFHGLADAVADTAEKDARALIAAGLSVEWRRRLPTFHSALITGPDGQTIIDWAMDSDFRFFPAEPDERLGWRLHPFDLATNKALAAAARREPRDVIDLITIHENQYPLSVVAWAAVAKDPGYSPLSLLDMIGRMARYRDEDLAALNMPDPPSAADLSMRLKTMLRVAEGFANAMPADRAGEVFLERGEVVQPDPDRLASYEVRTATRSGIWPSADRT